MLIGKRLAASTVLGLALTAAVSIGYAAASPVGPAVPAPRGAAAVPAPRGAVAAAVRPARAATSNNPSAAQNVFVPVTPCRVVDTRSGGGPIASTTSRNFYVAGTVGFPGQGGQSGGCGVPVGASAVAVTVTTVATQVSGYLTGYATGTSRPLANFISTSKTSTISANPVLPLAATTSQQLSIFAQGTTQVIVDVSGYYLSQIHAIVYASDTASSVASGSPAVTSITNVSVGVADLTLSRDVTFCTPVATADATGRYAFAYTFQGTNKIRVETWTLSSAAAVVPTNGYVHLTVTC